MRENVHITECVYGSMIYNFVFHEKYINFIAEEEFCYKCFFFFFSFKVFIFNDLVWMYFFFLSRILMRYVG